MEKSRLYIPNDWTETKLVDNSKLIMGQSPDSKYYNSEKGVKFLQGCSEFGITNPTVSVYSTNVKKIAPKNSILFSVRAPVGKINFADDDYCIGRGLAAIVPLNLDINYLYQYIKYYSSNIGFVAQGSTFDSINSADLGNLKILHPISTIEQKSISDILVKTDEAIAHVETLICKLKLIKKGLMQDLLNKGIDEIGNIRSEGTHKFKDSPLGRIPQEWMVKKMGDLISAIDPQPDHRTPPAVVDGVPYVGISDFTSNGKIDIINCRKVGFNVLEKQQKSFKIEEGDIIFGKIGTIGKPKILPDFMKLQFTLSANVILIKPIECSDFIYWTLTSDYINNQVSLAIHSTSQPAFGMEKIRHLNVLTPELKERVRISEKSKKLENALALEKIELSKLQSTKKGLMQDLLTGKVRVKK